MIRASEEDDDTEVESQSGERVGAALSSASGETSVDRAVAEKEGVEVV